MILKRGQVWFANLNPIHGSEQAGIRPVLIFQNDDLNIVTTTALAIPFTTNLRRAALPSSVIVARGEGGLATDSVALCHQLRALDKTRLQRKLGSVSQHTIEDVERSVLYTLGIV